MIFRTSTLVVRLRLAPILGAICCIIILLTIYAWSSGFTTADTNKFWESKSASSIFTDILVPSSHSFQQKNIDKIKLISSKSCNKTKYDSIGVYIYSNRYFNESGDEIYLKSSAEYKSILSAIRSSRFYAENLNETCLFVTDIDTLTEENINLPGGSSLLSSSQWWNEGRNHLLFNMFQSKNHPVTLNNVRENAVLAFSSRKYGDNYSGQHISIPSFNSLTVKSFKEVQRRPWRLNRQLLLLVDMTLLKVKHKQLFNNLAIASNQITLMGYCPRSTVEEKISMRCIGTKIHIYPTIIECGGFVFHCSSSDSKPLIVDVVGRCPSTQLDRNEYGISSRLQSVEISGRVSETLHLGYQANTKSWSPAFLDSIMMGCIPVVLKTGLYLPFSSVLDWERAAVFINEYQFPSLIKHLSKFTHSHISEMRRQVLYLWVNYFSTIEVITHSTLEILNGIVLQQKAKSYEDWNGAPSAFVNNKYHTGSIPPVFYPLQVKSAEGFTAVVLTYNRLKMLFELMKKLNDVPSLSKIVVVWNNPDVTPPQGDKWPELRIPFVIIHRKSNRLSNRFYPYREITTEAVFAIDDDILMLTLDEIEFGYKVWCEHPDRIVGFPGRHHIIESTSVRHDGLRQQFKYDSEWDNEISMVLTGSAFYHKMYAHYYTYKLPRQVRNFVDARLNCEDIAINFLIANLSRKAPIKVTPRKRFICSQCGGNESLWSDHRHFVKRSECLSRFTRVFGYMPLITVEFRADPVLYQSHAPFEFHSYHDIGFV